MIESILKWFVPPAGHDPGIELLWRWRLAVFGCLSFGLSVWLASSMVLEWGFLMVRPASAQTVQRQVNESKREVLASIAGMQQQLSTISTTQGSMQKQHDAERVEHVEQQLLWWRQQNCKSKGQARNYAWLKMSDLKTAYSELTGKDWQMPTCSDIGD